MKQIIKYEERRFIMMKSGLVHFVTEETGRKMSDHLANQSGHTFVKIKELDDISINTAEMEGVYNHEQYTELCRVKSGEWKCSYGKWHKKGGECKCKEDHYKAEQQRKKDAEEAEYAKTLTPEEKAKNSDKFAALAENAALDGSIIFREMFTRKNEPKVMRKKTVIEWERINQRKADTTGMKVMEL